MSIYVIYIYIYMMINVSPASHRDASLTTMVSSIVNTIVTTLVGLLLQITAVIWYNFAVKAAHHQESTIVIAIKQHACNHIARLRGIISLN